MTLEVFALNVAITRHCRVIRILENLVSKPLKHHDMTLFMMVNCGRPLLWYGFHCTGVFSGTSVLKVWYNWSALQFDNSVSKSALTSWIRWNASMGILLGHTYYIQFCSPLKSTFHRKVNSQKQYRKWNWTVRGDVTRSRNRPFHFFDKEEEDTDSGPCKR